MSGRPAGRGDAFEKLLSTKLFVRFAHGHHRMVGLFNKRCYNRLIWGGHPRRWRVPREGCQNWPLSYGSGMAQPIVTKFGVCLKTKKRCIMHRSWVGYICTCVRPHVQMCPFPHLVNGWTDCAEIWYVVRDPLLSVLQKSMTGYSCTCALAYPFSVSRERLNGLR